MKYNVQKDKIKKLYALAEGLCEGTRRERVEEASN